MKKTIATKIGAAAFSGAFAVTGLSATVGMIPVFAEQSNTTNTSNDAAETRDATRKTQNGDADIIDNSQKGTLHIFKYDTTSAEAAGDYKEGDIKATGQEDTGVSNALKDYAIAGVEFSYLKVGNIETYTTAGANGEVVVVYEIEDDLVDILGLSKTKTFDQDAKGYYPPADIITGENNTHGCSATGVHHYTSTQINDALAALLEADNITAKNALETYLRTYNTQDVDSDDATAHGATAMPVTNASGETTATNLPLGLYLIVETRVPEEVTNTVNPWFISLPFTNTSKQTTPGAVSGATSTVDTNHTDNGVASDDNNGGDYWLYDAYLYPKNQTGNPTFDKSVRNAYSKESISQGKGQKNNSVASTNGNYTSAIAGLRGNEAAGVASMEASQAAKDMIVYNPQDGVHSADTSDIAYVANRGGYTADENRTPGAGIYSKDFTYGDVTTASEGDILDYILVTKLPHITSKATYLSEFTFTDTLSPGLAFNNDPRIAIYDNKDDANSNNTKNAIEIWDYNRDNGNFGKDFANADVISRPEDKGKTVMTIRMTEAGLNRINNEVNDASASSVSDPSKGLSDYYMVVYYTATVESNEQVTLGDEGNANDAALTWSRTNNAMYNVLEDRNYMFTYGIDLTKTFSKPADGDFSKVEFKLYNETDAHYIIAEKAGDGLYYVSGTTRSKADATTLIPDSNGKLYVKGIEADKYELTEVKTADGFSLLRDHIVIDITSTDRDVKAAVAGTVGLDAEDAQKIIENYGSGIVNEDGQLVELQKSQGSTNQAPTFQTDVPGTTQGKGQGTGVAAPGTPNGRTIGKTDMYVGEIQEAHATIDGKACTLKNSSTGDTSSANAEAVLNVQNNKNWLLPATGGMGTYAATIAGIVILGMGLYSINKKKETA